MVYSSKLNFLLQLTVEVCIAIYEINKELIVTHAAISLKFRHNILKRLWRMIVSPDILCCCIHAVAKRNDVYERKER